MMTEPTRGQVQTWHEQEEFYTRMDECEIALDKMISAMLAMDVDDENLNRYSVLKDAIAEASTTINLFRMAEIPEGKFPEDEIHNLARDFRADLMQRVFAALDENGDDRHTTYMAIDLAVRVFIARLVNEKHVELAWWATIAEFDDGALSPDMGPPMDGNRYDVWVVNGDHKVRGATRGEDESYHAWIDWVIRGERDHWDDDPETHNKETSDE